MGIISTTKKNDRKLMIIAAIMSSIFTLPMTYLEDLISWIIILILWGIGIAGIFVVGNPIFADIIDENVALTKKRREGVFNGFATETAIFGIHISMALIPSLFMLCGTILFWKYYDLTSKRVNEIREKLRLIKL